MAFRLLRHLILTVLRVVMARQMRCVWHLRSRAPISGLARRRPVSDLHRLGGDILREGGCGDWLTREGKSHQYWEEIRDVGNSFVNSRPEMVTNDKEGQAGVTFKKSTR